MTQADDRADDLVPDDLLRAVEATLFAATEPITAEAISSHLGGASVRSALAELARHCTEQQVNADKVERRVRKSAAALLLAPRVGQRFEGIVTGASDRGTWVRITEPVAEGRVIRGFEGLDVGHRVRVELVHTDAARGFIDFARAK